MEKTKIDWCDSSWNPVTGCLHSCKYCYSRIIANRFSGGGEKWTGDALIELKDQLELAAKAFSDLNQTKTFLSIEPILEDITVSEYWDYYMAAHYVDWVIVGAETGHRKGKVIPERDWIRSITFDCFDESIPVFMKSSLADIWRNPLVQEFPKELLR